MKQRLKRWVFGLLGKDPEAVVVTFCSGDADLCRRMSEEVQRLVPERRHFTVTAENWPEMRRRLRRYRIGLAYNARLERHHLTLNLASYLFWRGVPLDRIYLRPWWWPWPKRERSSASSDYRVLEGRPCSPGRRRVAVLSPYFPYPLAHGGAVRIYNLVREMSQEFDVELFAFQDGPADPAPVLEFCARVVLVQQPRYREPRWSSLLPPQVRESRSPGMRRALAEERRAFGFECLQVEYTHMAEYGGDILVEHDVTFDLFGQIARRDRMLASWWNYCRWIRFERRALGRFRRVVVMSNKDAELIGKPPGAVVIENGVDLARFRPAPECPGQHLLFIGSFRHFPNIAAYRFFTETVWPTLREKFPEMRLTVVCGPDYLQYWQSFSNAPEPAPDPRIRMLGFVADVRPLYVEANLVLVPTTVSAGTNLKVLEAMAMRRAVVSTTSGCAGLGLLHDYSVWIADTAQAFAAGIATLIGDDERRHAIAEAAYAHALRHFDWSALGAKQRDLLRSILVRNAGDLAAGQEEQ